jgi:uncharacterized protein YjdB
LASLKITVPQGQIPVGLTEQLKAIGFYSDGSDKDLTTLVVWTSAHPDFATVSAGGVVTAKAAGSVTVTAMVDQKTATNSLTVIPAGLATLAINGGGSGIPVGSTEQLTAIGTYTDGSKNDVTSVATWASAQPDIAPVSSSGLVAGKAVGSASVSATIGTVDAQTQLTVTQATLVSIAVNSTRTAIPQGETQQLTVLGTYSDGSTGDLTSTATWTSSAPNVATVSAGGVANALAVGSVTATAMAGQKTGTISLTVIPAALVSLAINASSSEIPLGSTEQLTATGTYSDGSEHDVTSVTAWTSSQPNIALVSSSGLVTAEAIGSASVSATVGTVGAQTQFTVTPPALVSIAVNSTRTAIPLGETQQLTAIGTYTDGSTPDLTNTVTWTSSLPNIATVSAGGVVTALAVGSTDLQAALSGVTASITLTVQSIALTSYFTTDSSLPDSAVRISNPGISGSTLCAMFYVFDQDQQMSECCGCTISPDGLLTLSVQTDLSDNPLTGIQSAAGSVTIVPSDYNGTSCDASSVTPDGSEVAWATHLYGTAGSQIAVSETPFSTTTLGDTLAAALQAQCAMIQHLGSGQGICRCGTGE